MATTTADELARKTCVPCEGGVPPIGPEEASALLSGLAGWTLTPDGKRIRRTWVAKNFVAGISFFDRIAELAEAEGHHPDLHLEGYRNVTVEIWTHAIGGLSENDFILAAKIDKIPIALPKSASSPTANIPHA
jgi:4a-hydroxytetrahydrobiopterin dehydratase